MLLQAVESVLAQTYDDYELIVVDDGSGPETRKALEPFMDRIRYIYQENAGPSAARNHGIKESDGELVAFLDHDDLWLPE
jgi:glycosyltransferase involved in cell wall biosynthesis